MTTSDLFADVLLSGVMSVRGLLAVFGAIHHGVVPIVAGDDSGDDCETD